MSQKRRRNIGLEILRGIRQIKKGEVGRVIRFARPSKRATIATKTTRKP